MYVNEATREPPPGAKWAQLGPYRFLIPDFFLDQRAQRRPPVHELSAIPARNVSFTGLLIEAGGDPEELERYLADAAPSYQAEAIERTAVKLAGVPFERLLLRGPRAVTADPAAQVEIFAASLDDDLFSVTIAQLAAGETLRRLRDLCLGMTEAALIRRMNES